MECQLKSLDQKRLKHRTFHLLNGGIAVSRGLDVVTIGTYPGRTASDLIIGNTVSKNDKGSGSEVLHQKPSRNRLNQRPIGTTRALFNRCNLECRRCRG